MDREVDAVREASAATDIRVIVRRLSRRVGPTVVRAVAGVRDPKRPRLWADEHGPRPGVAAERRLRLAYAVWILIDAHEGPNLALAWMVGANPLLGDRTPISAIRDGDDRDVLGAAAAFVDHRGGM